MLHGTILHEIEYATKSCHAINQYIMCLKPGSFLAEVIVYLYGIHLLQLL